MGGWDFLVDKGDLTWTEVRPVPGAEDAALEPGEVLLGVERFSLTANNITYAVFGDRMGYWAFFPGPDGWGRIPVWGFARVLRSASDAVPVGQRLYGYLPMSTHFVTSLRASGLSFVDTSPHRQALAAAYNRYEPAEPGAHDDQLALLKPLFTTSFLLDDFMAEIAPDAIAVLSSASSKTALGLAWLLAQRGAPAVALTSPRNRAFVDNLGIYRSSTLYDAAGSMEVSGPAVYVDFAGDAGLRVAVHEALSDRLVHSAVVGGTHYDAPPLSRGDLPGPAPTFFFAPTQLAKRAAEWGAAELNARVRDSLTRFIAASDWLKVEHHNGPDALQAVYARTLAGRVGPSEGLMVLPSRNAAA